MAVAVRRKVLEAEDPDPLWALEADLRSQLCSVGHDEPLLVVQRLEAFFEAGELLKELREQPLLDRLEALRHIHDSLKELRLCETPGELIEAAPRELSRACGFSRALISRVQGSHWIPQVLESVPGRASGPGPFAAGQEGVELPLDHMLPEAELVRRRMPALIEAEVPYVAAPIMPTGRVIGFLHADRFGQDQRVTPADRDNLWIFAERFGFVFERAVLVERLAAQCDHLQDAFAGAEKVVQALVHRQIDLTRVERDPTETARSASALLRPAESRLDGLLTRREREVLDLMTSGATNTRIAEQLVISEGTVKSHVKHILRKLRATNRAAAVARYLQIMLREQEEARRP